jgi:peptide chain release factor 2
VRWGAFFDLPNKKQRLYELDQISAEPTFWNDSARAQTISKEKADLSAQISRLEKLYRSADDLRALLELFKESQEAEFLTEFNTEISNAESMIGEVELERMLCGEHDQHNAIIEINAGAGGTEAQDWAEMLLRMYTRWAERRGFSVELVDVSPGEGAGIKSATALIGGRNAFGYLRSERGVHRLVRISPFDSNARRHTSFASVMAMPDIEQDVDIDIRDDDLRIDTFRSGGAGGQHINKTDSAVRITHLPTNTVVVCQNERSQHKNKATAMKLLKAKLYELELEKKKDEMEKIAGERRKIDFGSQIRSYVMQPYQLVKDLRSDKEVGDVDRVLNGDLDPFIEAYLMSDELNVP